tara:strand:- start:31715 stop:31936 length:222 start_codon:yes stop_codon:yes gene_type:complete
MEINLSMDLWMYWVTAIVFTALGYAFARDKKASFEESRRITQETIDTLIEMGFIKTRLDDNNEIELVKYEEEI